jgi:hypothetical protein
MADYFLHVDILVEEKNARTFEGMVERLVRKQVESRSGAFYAARWQLELALKAVRPFEFEPSERSGSEVRVLDRRLEDKLCRRYVNLWNVPDPPDVAEVMQQLADDSIYSGINAIVVREIQNLVLAIQYVPDIKQSKGLPLDSKFVQVRRQFATPALGPYLFNGGALIPTIESKGWKSFGQYQNVTGHLNTVLELWRLPPPGGPQSLKDVMKGTPPGIQQMYAELEALPLAEWQDVLQPYIKLA